jgi:hypothetical protein
MILFDSGSERSKPVAKRKSTTTKGDTAGRSIDTKVRFVVYGIEMPEKAVNPSGKSGRIYPPSDRIGRRVKVARIT